MDTELLVDADIALGTKVFEALEPDSELAIRALLWWFDDNREQSVLILSTPLYESRGLPGAYLRLRKTLDRAHLLDNAPLDRFRIVSNSDPVLTALRTVAAGASHVRLVGCIINGLPVADAYIYKLDRRRIGPRKKR